jgi:hypothetical protein
MSRVVASRRRPETRRYAIRIAHVSSGWGGAPLVIAPLRHCLQLSIGRARLALREVMVESTGGAGDPELVGDLLMMGGALSPYPSSGSPLSMRRFD